MSSEMHDMFLRYKFTDRGGSNVFEKYHIEDRLCMKTPLGEIRLKPTEENTDVKTD
jgi:hypothetical protein